VDCLFATNAKLREHVCHKAYTVRKFVLNLHVSSNGPLKLLR